MDFASLCRPSVCWSGLDRTGCGHLALCSSLSGGTCGADLKTFEIGEPGQDKIYLPRWKLKLPWWSISDFQPAPARWQLIYRPFASNARGLRSPEARPGLFSPTRTLRA